MDTGATKLGFASYELRDNNFPGGVRRAPHEGPPPSMKIALVHENVDGAHAHALAAGCRSLAEPQDKPPGQRVAYVRDPFDTLVEIASPL